MNDMLKGRYNIVYNICLGYYSYTFLECSLFLYSSEQIHDRYFVSCQRAVCQQKQDSVCVYWLSCISCNNTLTALMVWSCLEFSVID